jgi:TetR/AcrR family transcriptional repressor of mexJK operon
MGNSVEPADLPQRRGRPRDPERRRRVLDAARRQFHANGYERTSVDAVAADSGVSKMTVYSYFPSKEALFAAVIASRTGNTFGPDKLDHGDPAQPDKVLRKVGAEFLRLMRNEQVMGQFKVLYAAAPQQREACAAFYREGPQRLVGELAAYLRRVHECGSLRIGDPEVAADQFLAMFLGAAYIASMLGLGKPSKAEDTRLLAENVSVFIRAHAVAAKTAGSRRTLR